MTRRTFCATLLAPFVVRPVRTETLLFRTLSDRELMEALHQDLTRIQQEIRDLCRKQTFSVLNVPLCEGEQAMTLEEARAWMGFA